MGFERGVLRGLSGAWRVEVKEEGEPEKGLEMEECAKEPDFRLRLVVVEGKYTSWGEVKAGAVGRAASRRGVEMKVGEMRKRFQPVMYVEI